MLTANESRILGVLIEKSLTTPGQYPMTSNAIVNGANQKNNREPVTNLTEDHVLDALDGLRAKGFVREVMLSGSRVQKFRHLAREAIEVSTSELVVLAELMLRGPQTVGEIRGRASRMHPLESLEIAQNILEHLQQRDPALVEPVAPAPGSRAGRWAQRLCPDLHPVEAAPASAPAAAPPAASAPAVASNPLEDRVAALEAEVERLGRIVSELE